MPLIHTPYDSRPSLQGGYCHGATDNPKYPELWKELRLAWAMGLGKTPHGTVLDRSQFGMVGTMTNMDAATDWVVIDGERCLDIDTTDDQIAGTDSPQIQFDYTDSFSLCARVWRPSAETFGFILNKSQIGGDERGYGLIYQPLLNFALKNASLNWMSLLGATTVPTNVWSNVGASWHADGTGTGTNAKVYLNGVDDSVYPADKDTLSATVLFATPIDMANHEAGFMHAKFMSYGLVYGRALLPKEFMLLHVDPMALFRRRSRTYSFPAAAPFLPYYSRELNDTLIRM